MLGTPRDMMLSWRRSTGLNNGGSNQHQMYFIVHLQNNKSTKVSPQTFFSLFFCFVLLLEEVYYANLYLTTAANSPSDESREGESRGELEGLQSHFTACFSSTDVGGKQQQKKKKQGNILAESTISAGFGLSWRPQPPQQTHFVLHYGLQLFFLLFFCHHNNRVQQ